MEPRTPRGPIRAVDAAELDAVAEAARANPRRRMNSNLHRMGDPVHRLLNAIEPESYVRPHRHAQPPKAETLTVLRGRGAVLVFDDAGTVVGAAVLSASGPHFVAEVLAGAWHALVALEPGTVWFEVKEGPYVQPVPADWAQWAPDPASPAASAYLDRLRRIAADVTRSSA